MGLIGRIRSCRRWASTIYAVSSGFGKCGVSVLRVSGPQASDSLRALSPLALEALSHPRKAVFSPLLDPHTSSLIDRGLILWFPGPSSFTGEDSVEYQVHGSVAVLRELNRLLGTFDNHRHAEAGEFTKRAFMNGKMDLTKVDGLADLIHAETEEQRKQAMRQMEGDLYDLYQKWTQRIITITSHIEALIDFSESEILDPNLEERIREDIKQVIADIRQHIDNFRVGERIRNGVRVVILGKPNVGKSSLLNLLLQRPAAIISSTPGTTRDLLQFQMDLGGYPVMLSDTAGIRDDSNDPIEVEGIKRARNEALSADIIIQMKDISQGAADEDEWNVPQQHHNVITVYNKVDLLKDESPPPLDGSAFPISVVQSKGIQPLLEALTAKVQELCQEGGNEGSSSPSLTRVRYRTHCSKAAGFLEKTLAQDLENNTDVAGHYCRLAMREIESIVGKIDPESIFDVIFADFCVGK